MQRSRGFTIVELLIVIVVIAILAAISFVAYTGIRNRTFDSTVQNDLSTMSKKFEFFNVDNSRYPTGTSSSELRDELQTLPDMKLTSSVIKSDASSVLYITEPGGTNYALLIGSQSGQTYYISSLDAKTPKKYTAGAHWSTVYPGSGSPSGIGANIGLQGTLVGYYVHTSSSGLRMWN